MCTKEIEDYRILYAGKTVELNERIKELIEKGWTVFSELQTYNDGKMIDYIQPMVKYKQREE